MAETNDILRFLLLLLLVLFLFLLTVLSSNLYLFRFLTSFSVVKCYWLFFCFPPFVSPFQSIYSIWCTPSEAPECRMAGRPPIEIEGGHVRELRGMGFSWDYISSELEVNAKTCTTGASARVTKRASPSIVKTLLTWWSFLFARSTAWSRRTFHLVTPPIWRRFSTYHARACTGKYSSRRSCELNRMKYAQIKRAVYHVPGPHNLWHIDGWHKLIRYGLVVMGCIVGCTRTLIYLW